MSISCIAGTLAKTPVTSDDRRNDTTIFSLGHTTTDIRIYVISTRIVIFILNKNIMNEFLIYP